MIWLILWISLTPGQWVSLELPMPSLQACEQAIREAKISPKPHEKVMKCQVRP